MDRPYWYSEGSESEPRSRLNIPPLRTWSGNSLLLLTLAVMLFCQLLFRAAFGFSLSDQLELRPSDLVNPLHWYQFVTYALLHSETSILHLAFNCLLLYFLGPPVEAILRGRRSYLAFCAGGAAAGGLAYVAEAAFVPGPAVPMLGASAICYAVLVAFATHDPQRELMLIFPPLPVKAWAMAAILMGASLLWHLMGPDGVAHVAHLGGGVFGFLFIRYRGRVQVSLAGMRRRRADTRTRRNLERRQEIDRILDKINQTGIGSLSRSERRFLEAASREYRERR